MSNSVDYTYHIENVHVLHVENYIQLLIMILWLSRNNKHVNSEYLSSRLQLSHMPTVHMYVHTNRMKEQLGQEATMNWR